LLILLGIVALTVLAVSPAYAIDPIQFVLSVDDATPASGSTVTVSISKTGDWEGDDIVLRLYTVNGSLSDPGASVANATSDYVALNQTFTFQDGEPDEVRTATISVLNNPDNPTPKYFTVVLTNVTATQEAMNAVQSPNLVVLAIGRYAPFSATGLNTSWGDLIALLLVVPIAIIGWFLLRVINGEGIDFGIVKFVIMIAGMFIAIYVVQAILNVISAALP
jgi:hypothetical protein